MAFTHKSHSRHHLRKKRATINDINITPFVDILLVLLVIFMITAPMINSSVELELPKGVKSDSKQPQEVITVSIGADGLFYLQNQTIRPSALEVELLKLTKNNFNSKIFVRADKKISYGKVMEVVKIINTAGFSQVILVTEVDGNS